MSVAIRKIEYKALWDKQATEDQKSWLSDKDVCADALADLKTKQNAISIYVLEESSPITIDRIIGALAAGRQYLSKFDYIVFDTNILDTLKIEVKNTRGETPDPAVDAVHRDLVNLTASKLANLAGSMRMSGEAKRKGDKEVGRLINSSLKAGHISSAGINPELLPKLSDPKFAPTE